MAYKVYYQEELPENVIKLILDTPHHQFGDQTGLVTKDILIESTKQQVISGALCLFVYKQVVIFLRATTPYMGTVDFLISKKGSSYQCLCAFKQFISWAENNTYYHKLQGRTFVQPLLRYLKYFPKAKLEGIHTESFRTPQGVFIDEYTVGYILSKSLLNKEK